MDPHEQNLTQREAAEIVRSAFEAKRKDEENLRIKPEILLRYSNPPADTCFPLEYAYYLLGNVPGKTVLDYGCGLGENSVLIAMRGATVIGVDISPDLIGLATKRVEQHELSPSVRFRVGSAHELPIEDDSIDVVFGMAILHHLDLRLASAEVVRVLKKGGRAIFLEPVRNSKLMGVLRSLIPYRQPDISPFERPLTDKELMEFGARFAGYRSRAFSLPFVNLIRVLGMPSNVVNAAYRIDRSILNEVRFLNHYATTRVIEMIK